MKAVWKKGEKKVGQKSLEGGALGGHLGTDEKREKYVQERRTKGGGWRASREAK